MQDARSGEGPSPLEREHWLAAEIAARRPLLLVVDDVQWADPASLRWLAYLGRRLAGVALLAVIVCRDAEPGTEPTLVERVIAASEAPTLRPQPLSPDAVGVWLKAAYGRPPEDEFARACHRASGGTPFLLRELTASLRAEGIEPDTAAAAAVDVIAPASIRAFRAAARGAARA